MLLNLVRDSHSSPILRCAIPYYEETVNEMHRGNSSHPRFRYINSHLETGGSIVGAEISWQ